MGYIGAEISLDIVLMAGAWLDDITDTWRLAGSNRVGRETGLRYKQSESFNY